MKEYTKNLGKVVMTPKGAWSIEKEYEILDIVHDSITDHAYISKQEVPSGVDLSDSRYWMPLNVSGYSDSNVIALNSFNKDGEIQSYTLEEAIKAIKDVGRKSGAILIFYNNNVNRLDITTGCWEIWQFNSINVYDWENLDAWINIYYNYNKFVGWYAAENVLNKEIPNPDIGCYAFVGNIYNEAFVYRCDVKNRWTKTNQKAQHYVKVVFGNNVSIGANGNWWQDGVDTNIPVSIKGDNGLTPYLRWSVNNQIEYSYDNINWHILSDKFNTNIKIKDYVNAITNLPNNVELGTIYGVGPVYAEDDIEQINPIYNIYVYTSNGWINNGEFNGISVGVVQEIGDSETAVMSQKAVTSKIADLESNIGFKYYILVTKPYYYAFIHSFKKGDIISMNVKTLSSAGPSAVYIQNSSGDSLLTLYGSDGYVEKIVESDFSSARIYVFGGESYETEITIRVNRYADSYNLNFVDNKVRNLYCRTSGDEIIKVVNEDANINLDKGVRYAIQMYHKNTVENAKLQIGNSKALPLRYNDEVVNSENTWGDYEWIDVILDVEANVYRSWKIFDNTDIVNSIKEDVEKLNSIKQIKRTLYNLNWEQGSAVWYSEKRIHAKLGKLKKGILQVLVPNGYEFIVVAHRADDYKEVIGGSEWLSKETNYEIDGISYYTIDVAKGGEIIFPEEMKDYYCYNILDGELNSIVNDNIKSIDLIQEELNLLKVPKYYEEHIAEKLYQIKARDEAYGQNGDSFIFITDTHVEVNHCHSGALVKYINEHSYPKIMINGGDVIHSGFDDKTKCRYFIQKWFELFPNVRQYVSLGNHDYNTQGEHLQNPDLCLSSAEMYANFNKINENIIDTKTKNYYYIDNKSQKIRYYILDLHYYRRNDYKGNSLEFDNQLAWLESTAKEIGKEWTILIFYHMHYVGSNVLDGVVESVTTNPLATELLAKIDSLYDNEDMPIVAGIITGHTHFDWYEQTAKGYPIIATMSDAAFDIRSGDDTWSNYRKKGTIYEQSFNVVHIDKTNRKLLFTRIGIGEDKSFTY